jgi:hypothetical protein
VVRLVWGLREKAEVKGHVSRHAIEEKLKSAEDSRKGRKKKILKEIKLGEMRRVEIVGKN